MTSFVLRASVLAGGVLTGLVVQALGVEADELAVFAGLAVGHDDVGVQVRITAPRRLVLISDGHQAWQAHKVFLSGAPVVHPAVAGVRGQVLPRF